MKYKRMFEWFKILLIPTLIILSFYFIMANVFNLNKITDKYGNNTDISYLKI